MNFGWLSFSLMLVIHKAISAEDFQDASDTVNAIEDPVKGQTSDADLDLDVPSAVPVVQSATSMDNSTAANNSITNPIIAANSTLIRGGPGIPYSVGSTSQVLPGTSLIRVFSNGTNTSEIRTVDGWLSLAPNGDLLSNTAVDAGPVNETGFAKVKAFPLPTGAAIPVMPGTTGMLVLSNETVLQTGFGWDSSRSVVVGHTSVPEEMEKPASAPELDVGHLVQSILQSIFGGQGTDESGQWGGLGQSLGAFPGNAGEGLESGADVGRRGWGSAGFGGNGGWGQKRMGWGSRKSENQDRESATQSSYANGFGMLTSQVVLPFGSDIGAGQGLDGMMGPEEVDCSQCRFIRTTRYMRLCLESCHRMMTTM